MSSTHIRIWNGSATRILEVALAAAEKAPDQLAFIEVILDRHDMPPVLIDVAKAVANQNN
jgi:TPP-dependent 2-oxoacid decarboxylase